MRAFGGRRRLGAPATFAAPVVGVVVASLVVVVALLWGFGLIDASRFRSNERSTAGLVPVPTPARAIPAYARVTRDHLWDPRSRSLAVVYLPPRSVTREMLVSVSDIIGRVLDHEKSPGYVFTEADFLPRGTREGLVGGIPAGKRAIRVPADKVDGLFGLHAGDRFDLVATMPIDASQSGSSFNFGGVYGQQLALQARLSNWQKQATVRVMVQNGVIVEAMSTRQVPVMQASLTERAAARMRPVQEVVIAIDPEEVARLTEAMAVEARIWMVPRSGRPGDPEDSRTPDLDPVSPFSGPGSPMASGPGPDAQAEPGVGRFTYVETIKGQKRELTAVPRP